MKVQHHREVEAQPSPETDGVSLRWVIDEKDGAPNFAMRVIQVEAESATAFHAHPWEHEVYVLSGEGVVKSEEAVSHIGEGDVVFVPPDEMHQFASRGDDPLRFICVVPVPSKVKKG